MTKQLVASQQKELTKHTHRIIRNGPKIHESNEQCLADLHRRILVNILEIGNSDAFKKKVSKKLLKIQIEPLDKDADSFEKRVRMTRVALCHADGVKNEGYSSQLIALVETKSGLIDYAQFHVRTIPLNNSIIDMEVCFLMKFWIVGKITNIPYTMGWDGKLLLDAKCPPRVCQQFAWNDILDRVVDWIVIGRDRVRRGLSYE
jgi:hypothetical protein